MKITPQIIRTVNICFATGVSAVFFRKAFYSKERKEILELKINDKPAPVTPKIRNLINEVLVDMKLDEEEKKTITPYITKGYDLNHIGVSLFRREIYLGIPEHFLLDSEELNDLIVEVEGKPLVKQSRDFQWLKHSLSLSDEAKKFAIAHQLYLSKHRDIIVYSVLPTLISVKCFILSYLYEKAQKTLKKPQKNHVHLLLFLAGVWIYALCHDVLCIYGEGNSDHLAAELGDSYVKGGVEYYRKLIERNKLFKKLNENAPYSQNGDIIISTIRTDHMPLYRRLKYLTDMSKGVKSSVWVHVMYS